MTSRSDDAGPTPPHDGSAVVGMIGNLREQLLDALDEVNADIDRLVDVRERFRAALQALDPGAPVAPAPAATKPSVPRPAAAPKRERKAPTFAGPTGTTTKRPGKYDLAAVADVARNAHVDGRPMGKAVGAVFEVKDPMAQYLIKKAREAGHDIPQRTVPTAVRVAAAAVAPSTGWQPGMAAQLLGDKTDDDAA